MGHFVLRFCCYGHLCWSGLFARACVDSRVRLLAECLVISDGKVFSGEVATPQQRPGKINGPVVGRTCKVYPVMYGLRAKGEGSL
ncbi:hypothetical protein K456DRAFT_398478 [Colletotrichum gloeosporioides 23]|nr:hypothetical protein K456DRAFT_398478 [Colletotrichum gloeosporioides 23]